MKKLPKFKVIRCWNLFAVRAVIVDMLIAR